MCGIAGWFSNAPHPPDATTRLGTMVAAIRQRGPDGEGLRLYAHAALGHARLAIIDPAGGAQPMEDGGVAISFNGEIYNYRALREELAGAGYRFRTHSDTEVILALYRTAGWRALARLRGMYAFALWDAGRATGWLVRDPLGIKPLFVAETPGALLFGSEAKALLAYGSLSTELDTAALHLLINLRYLPGERTLFRGIRQLAPGAVVEWDPQRTREHRLPDYPDGADDVAGALRECVAAHMTADVEVGAYLSGGIDSAAVVALARPHGLRRTFTLAVGDDPAEAQNAAASARLLGVENVCGAGADLAERLPRVIRALEVPKVNALQVGAVATVAARQVKVVLSGLGGDELFYGYNAHRIMHQAGLLARAIPGPLHRLVGSTAARLLARATDLPWSEQERAAHMLAALGAWPRVYGLLRNVWDRPDLRRALYGPRLLDADLPDAFAEVAARWPNEPDPVVAMARFERGEKMVNDLLWQEDRLSMAEGLEVRVPFVDLPLTRAVDRLRRAQLMPRGRLKGYLRDRLAPLLPAAILSRPKSGFQVDAPTFFHAHLLALARDYLNDATIRRHGLFNPRFVARLLAAPPRRDLRWHYFILYLMLGTHLWLEVFPEHAGPPPLEPRSDPTRV